MIFNVLYCVLFIFMIFINIYWTFLSMIFLLFNWTQQLYQKTKQSSSFAQCCHVLSLSLFCLLLLLSSVLSLSLLLSSHILSMSLLLLSITFISLCCLLLLSPVPFSCLSFTPLPVFIFFTRSFFPLSSLSFFPPSILFCCVIAWVLIRAILIGAITLTIGGRICLLLWWCSYVPLHRWDIPIFNGHHWLINILFMLSFHPFSRIYVNLSMKLVK